MSSRRVWRIVDAWKLPLGVRDVESARNAPVQNCGRFHRNVDDTSRRRALPLGPRLSPMAPWTSMGRDSNGDRGPLELTPGETQMFHCGETKIRPTIRQKSDTIPLLEKPEGTPLPEKYPSGQSVSHERMRTWTSHKHTRPYSTPTHMRASADVAVWQAPKRLLLAVSVLALFPMLKTSGP
jgi:hypothetical protein